MGDGNEPTGAEHSSAEPDLLAAERVVRRVAEELTAALRSKWPDAAVEFWIGNADRHGMIAGRIQKGASKGYGSEWRDGKTLAETVAKVREFIAAIPDPHAHDWWFDPNDPRNRAEVA